MNNLPIPSTIKPLFKSSIGFDSIMDVFDGIFNDNFSKMENYPPHNIVKLSDKDYKISIALAGFDEKDIEVTQDKNNLTIHSEGVEESGDHLYKGIARRSFTKTFRLMNRVKVEKASMKNGMLNIYLSYEIPENEQVQKIEISLED